MGEARGRAPVAEGGRGPATRGDAHVAAQWQREEGGQRQQQQTATVLWSETSHSCGKIQTAKATVGKAPAAGGTAVAQANPAIFYNLFT